MPRKTPGPPCSVCREPSVAKGFCDKHYRRWHKFGDTTATLRPKDWGKRESHPLYGQWTWTNRGIIGRDERWNEFATFLEDVGDRPGPDHRLRRLDTSKPWGPENYHWRKTLSGRTYTLETAEGKREYQRVWRANNRLRSKHNDLKKNYGITLVEYDEMLERQHGCCAICGTPQEDCTGARLCIDHCHDSGAVRGLLCHPCNRALGLFKDDPTRLRVAIAYLKNRGNYALRE
jgi:hypothetical protein